MNEEVELRAAAAARELWVMADGVALRGDVAGTGMVAIDVTVPPGSGVPPHRHASPETFRVLSGRLTVARAAAGGAFEEIEAGPGDMISIPAEAPHGYRNAGAEPVVFMAVVDPALAAFFEAAAAPERPSGPPTPEAISRIMALAEAHGIRMLQPA